MSNIFSYNDAQKKIEQLNIPFMVKNQVNEHKLNLNHVSRLLGKPNNFMLQQLKNKNPAVALFYALSIHLNMNFFEPFQNLLPENLRTTKREQELLAQIADRDKQIADLKKEIEIMNRFVK